MSLSDDHHGGPDPGQWNEHQFYVVVRPGGFFKTFIWRCALEVAIYDSFSSNLHNKFVSEIAWTSTVVKRILFNLLSFFPPKSLAFEPQKSNFRGNSPFHT